MSKYSPEEIAEFKAKELRIVREAMLKSLIEKLPLEDVYAVEKVTELAEKYVDYVYLERSKEGHVSSVTGNAKLNCGWAEVAEGLNLAIPDSQNIKILNLIIDEYKQANKASANPKADILTHIINTFGTYPTNTKSVEKVVQSLIEAK